MSENLFDAANAHITEQGHYCNQLMETINRQGAVIKSLMKRVKVLERALAETEESRRVLQDQLTRIHSKINEASRSV